MQPNKQAYKQANKQQLTLNIEYLKQIGIHYTPKTNQPQNK